ncbi:LysR family transcriptional regulator [Aeromonas dhakensis]
MSQTMINELRSITTFVHTAELGSLSKAAEAQQISPQAASKALGQLESYLGVRLFHRTTRSMSLTEEGNDFWSRRSLPCSACSRP